ncbi:MAG: ABC transporter permease [Planctomycetota bacterium]|nr:ABC transporter permease [Planctomycetota bacterium]
MRRTLTIFKRELAGYFVTPVAYVFIVIFLVLMGVFTFSRDLGNFYDNRQADLRAFFFWHPWLYLLLIPAISMRLWAEERKLGTIELLLTLPVTMTQAVIGKFAAAWAFAGIALLLTFPVWITVNYLGEPDNTAILAGYVGSFLTSGGYLAIGACVSSLTKNQVIAFILSTACCFGFLMAGYPTVLDFFSGWLPATVTDAIGSFSFYTHYQSISKGLIDARDLVFYLTVIAFFLFANALILDVKKAD